MNDRVGQSREVSLKPYQPFPMPGDNNNPPLPANSTHNLACGFVGIHTQPGWDRIKSVFPQLTGVVHLANLGLNEARRYQGDGDATRSEFVTEALCQGEHRGLAHAIG